MGKKKPVIYPEIEEKIINVGYESQEEYKTTSQ